jgi:hypothetical protein
LKRQFKGKPQIIQVISKAFDNSKTHPEARQFELETIRFEKKNSKEQNGQRKIIRKSRFPDQIRKFSNHQKKLFRPIRQ